MQKTRVPFSREQKTILNKDGRLYAIDFIFLQPFSCDYGNSLAVSAAAGAFIKSCREPRNGRIDMTMP